MPIATPVSARPIVATEPKLVPVNTAMTAQRTNVSGRMMPGLQSFSPKYIRDGTVPPMIHAPTMMPTIIRITMGTRLSLMTLSMAFWISAQGTRKYSAVRIATIAPRNSAICEPMPSFRPITTAALTSSRPMQASAMVGVRFGFLTFSCLSFMDQNSFSQISKGLCDGAQAH